MLTVIDSGADSASDALLGDSGGDFAPDTVGDTGPITDLRGTAWSGGGVLLTFVYEEGVFNDGCYGGYITGPFTVTDGAFDWPARFNVGAGGPEPRDVRAVGTVTRERLILSIVEVTGEPFWGPWTLFPSEHVDVDMCD